MPNNSKKSKKTEIRVRGVSPKLHDEIGNIAENLGITVNDFLKPALREIAEKYPDKMKEPPPIY